MAKDPIRRAAGLKASGTRKDNVEGETRNEVYLQRKRDDTLAARAAAAYLALMKLGLIRATTILEEMVKEHCQAPQKVVK